MNDLHQRIETNFNKQGLMQTLGASLDKVKKDWFRFRVALMKAILSSTTISMQE